MSNLNIIGDLNISGGGRIGGNKIISDILTEPLANQGNLIDGECAFRLSNGIIVNIFTISSSSRHNFLIPYVVGYNYSCTIEYNGGNFRGERLYFSQADLSGVTIGAFTEPVHVIVIGM